MKKIAFLLSAVLLAASFSGCAKNVSNNHNDKIQVYASFYAMYDFSKKIGGDKAVVTNLVPSGTEPHDWEPSPSDIVSLQNADVFVYSGAGMEHWAEKVLLTLSGDKPVVVEASNGLNLIGDGVTDPHVWLSIKNAKKQMENIKNALAQADPDNSRYYSDNYIKYANELDVLEGEYSETLSRLPNKNIVVTHEAFGYLCADYGLNQIAIEGLAPHSEPEPAKMAEIIEFVKENNVRVIFFEELASPRVAETIAKATGAGADVLNPLGSMSAQRQSNGCDYLSVMRENLSALKAALK